MTVTLARSGQVVVAGGFGTTPERGEGFVRLYDARVLTVDLGQK